MKTIVKIYVPRDASGIARNAPLLIENLKTQEFHGIGQAPELLAQVDDDEHEACFEADWDGTCYTFGRRVPEPDRHRRTLH
jgi:hypothetical protein